MYTKREIKIQIICTIHGSFEKSVACHIDKRKPQGCPKCSREQQTEKSKVFYDLREIKEKAEALYGTYYTYPDQKPMTIRDKITIICPVHGEYIQLLRSHLSGFHCNSCSYITRSKNRVKPLKVFIAQADELHNFSFNYEKFIYINSRTAGEIKCKTCSYVFHMTPQLHLTHGLGCPQCSVANHNPTNIFTKVMKAGSSYDDYPCKLYVIEFSDDNEKFLKVGVTTNTISERFRKIRYHLKIIHEIDTTVTRALSQEKEILNELKEFKYKPLKDFSGYTECLDVQTLSNINVLLARNGQRDSSLIAGTP